MSINTSMHCLNSIHTVLSTFVQGVSREGMAHICGALFCPCLACKGVVRVHDSNGTFVAVAEEGRAVYARCADSSCCCSEKDVESGWMDVVKDSGSRPWVKNSGSRPWVKLTEEKLAEFESRVQQQKMTAGQGTKQTTAARKKRPRGSETAST